MTYLDLIKTKWQNIAVIILTTVVLSLVFSLIQPLEYGSKVDLLIVQKQNINLDAYASARASEKTALNLSRVIETKSFLNKVLNSNFGIDKDEFPVEENKLRKYWAKKVEAKVFPETSILSVQVFDTDKKQANIISQSVAYNLVNSSAEYLGGGQDTFIKVVNEPLVSNYPVRPKILLNVLLGFILSLVISSVWLIYDFNVKLDKEIRKYDEEIYKNTRI